MAPRFAIKPAFVLLLNIGFFCLVPLPTSTRVISYKRALVDTALSPLADLPSLDSINETLLASSEDHRLVAPYIIMLAQSVDVQTYADSLTQAFDSDVDYPGSKIGYVYGENILHGFSAQLTIKALAYLKLSKEVVEITEDTAMYILPIVSSIQVPDVLAESSEGSPGVFSNDKSVTVQKNAPWNLQRISQRNRLNATSRGSELTDYSYSYQNPGGKGTYVYVLDTGVRASHLDFEGRAEMAAQFGGYELDDGNGHGTHCAGSVAGQRWGVSKLAKVRAVKVLADSGKGATSDIIAGIQYVVQQYKLLKYAPTVASLSLGGGKNSALDRAVQSAISQGIHFAVAAGNSNEDACTSSPAASPDAIVVAASDIQDNRASYSNWGACVDVFAPGTDVTSAWIKNDNSTARISGTSMATPQVAGLMAYYLSQANRTTKELADLIRSTSTSNVINLKKEAAKGMVASTPNRLIFNSVPS